MTTFRLANPCQNKESKQKKHDKRDKRNANECLFNTSLCSETCAINFDITIWHLKWFMLGHAWPIHLITGVKRKRIN